MSVEVNPVGLHCKMACQYCYELAPRRSTRNVRPAVVNHEAIQAELIRACGPDGFSLHGGEPLLAAPDDLERLWAFGLERWGRNGVQTSGADLTDEIYELIRKYKVHVGFSIDGPGDLNDARRRGTETRAATDRSLSWLMRCLADGVRCSLIVTLHAFNARDEKLFRLLAWFRGLDAAGLQSARLHILERDSFGGDLIALSDEENVRAMLACRALERELKTLRFDVFKDIEAKLRDPEASATCIWNGCDPLSTPAVHGVEADGSRHGCSRLSKDGRQWTPLPTPSNFRARALWNTPQDEGGCARCRFFLQCGGNCPGTAIRGDWRKRTQDCKTWFAVLELIEGEMIARGEQPASLCDDLDARVERRLSKAARPGGHGDRPHGDSHGDHTDTLRLAGGERVQ